MKTTFDSLNVVYLVHYKSLRSSSPSYIQIFDHVNAVRGLQQSPPRDTLTPCWIYPGTDWSGQDFFFYGSIRNSEAF